jgi:hypothetical protein
VPSRPNVLCLVTDQQRADHLGCAGDPVLRTPHLDALAAGGVRFERAYVNNPLCMPGRSTWFTGLTPRGHGVRTNGIPLRQDLPTMPGALAAVGYRTHSWANASDDFYDALTASTPPPGPGTLRRVPRLGNTAPWCAALPLLRTAEAESSAATATAFWRLFKMVEVRSRVPRRCWRRPPAAPRPARQQT